MRTNVPSYLHGYVRGIRNNEKMGEKNLEKNAHLGLIRKLEILIFLIQLVILYKQANES